MDMEIKLSCICGNEHKYNILKTKGLSDNIELDLVETLKDDDNFGIVPTLEGLMFKCKKCNEIIEVVW